METVAAAGLAGSSSERGWQHESLDDARSCFRGGALHLLEKKYAQWRDTGGFDQHPQAADSEGDHLPETEVE